MCLKVFVFIYFLSKLCGAYKLLVVFPLPGKSHSILGEGYVRHLINAGHEVTYVTAIPANMSSKNLRQILLESNYQHFPDDDIKLDMSRMMTIGGSMLPLPTVLDMMFHLAKGTLQHPKLQDLMNDLDEKFDAVVAEWMYNELYSGIATVFNCPLIWSSSLNPHHLVLSLIDEAPNPAYSPDLHSSAVSPFNFWERCQELWKQVYLKILQWQRSGRNNQAYTEAFTPPLKIRGRSLPPYGEVKHNASLMLGNSHVSTGEAIRLPQNYINIGGYHIDDVVKLLPKEIQNIMDNAKHGVIYFSMGTMLKSRTMPDVLKRQLMDMFSDLKHTVLWKFEETLPNLPTNVHIVKWAPQQSILAHPNCVLFITHGGLLSTTEAIHFGVPIIGIPMFADQALNVHRAETKGFAKRVNFDYDTPGNLRSAIEEILGNPRYKERVKELSLIHHDRLVSPGAELVHWVEHVVRTRGAPHLRSPALMVPWYQKCYLDLIAAILVLASTIIYVLRKSYKMVFIKSVDSKKNN